MRVLHLGAFWSLAIVQPLLDVFAENPEFFVAHAARPVDLVTFVLLMCAVGPILGCLVIWCADRAGAGTIAEWGVISFLLALVVLPIINRSWPLGPVHTLVLAAAVGGGVAAAYARLSPLRLFATFLSPAIVVVPTVFLVDPNVRGLVWSPQNDHEAPEISLAHTPPIVMVVFDQLPLPSLLGRNGSIDETLYPSFASLARDAVWFSGATAVADLTEMALPAVLTGKRPVVGRLPTAAAHPGNLFTLLGSRYRVVGAEPITRLCPDTVCQRLHSSVFQWFGSVLSDVAVVYLHIVSPAALADRLPAITQNWKNFVANDNWRGRWARHRDGDRRVTVNEFVEAVEPLSDGRPPFYFLHVLLPHEPWVHLPSGQRYSVGGRMVGLNREGRWTDDESAVLRAYQRHLLQARFADTLLGEVLGRLRSVGLYDDALIVVTSDHGASFQPDFLFRRPRPESFAEIASVPLLVKLPEQEEGYVVTANVETIDIAPIVGGVLGATLPWDTDGLDALAPDAVYRDQKVLVFSDGNGEATALSDIQADVDDVVTRKFARFETPDGFEQPKLGLYDDLVGRRVDEFTLSAPADVRVDVDLPDFFREVDPAASFLPAHITGVVVDLADGAERPALAVAVNGVIAAMTRPYGFRVAGRRHMWEVVVDPRRIVAGTNEIAVFEVRADETDKPMLHMAYRSAAGDASSAPNLILQPAEHLLGVTTSGFFGVEWSRQQPFRWTSGTAVVRVDTDAAGSPLAELFVEVLMTGPMLKTVTLDIDGCALFEGEIFGAWRQSFPLSGCRLGREVEIELRSTVGGPTPTDSRALGVAVARLELR